MGVYVERPQQFEARQFTSDPAEQSALGYWLMDGWTIPATLTTALPTGGGQGHSVKLEIDLPNKSIVGQDNKVKIDIGDWLVWNIGTREWQVLSDSEFKQNFLPV